MRLRTHFDRWHTRHRWPISIVPHTALRECGVSFVDCCAEGRVCVSAASEQSKQAGGFRSLLLHFTARSPPLFPRRSTSIHHTTPHNRTLFHRCSLQRQFALLESKQAHTKAHTATTQQRHSPLKSRSSSLLSSLVMTSVVFHPSLGRFAGEELASGSESEGYYSRRQIAAAAPSRREVGLHHGAAPGSRRMRRHINDTTAFSESEYDTATGQPARRGKQRAYR